MSDLLYYTPNFNVTARETLEIWEDSLQLPSDLRSHLASDSKDSCTDGPPSSNPSGPATPHFQSCHQGDIELVWKAVAYTPLVGSSKGGIYAEDGQRGEG